MYSSHMSDRHGNMIRSLIVVGEVDVISEKKTSA